MNIVTIIQARFGSTRLPGKVLLDIAGRPMLEHVVRRVQRSRIARQTVVATTALRRDDVIVELCRSLGVPTYRGSEEDVIDRYHGAARQFEAEAVVRITADCPLLDAAVMDRVLAAFLENRPDYASNTLVRTYPRGLDTEVFTRAALEAAWREASAKEHRVHVTPYLYLTPGRFRTFSVEDSPDYSDLRLTVDTEEDLELVRQVYEHLGREGRFTWMDVVDLMRREPTLAAVNAHVEQKNLSED